MKNNYQMNYLSFKEFVDTNGLKTEATSNIKIEEILHILNINSTGIYMRGDKFTTTAGLVNSHPTKGTHWVMYTNKNYFDSYGSPPPVNITKQINAGFHSDYQIQKDDSYCAAIVYLFYILHKL